MLITGLLLDNIKCFAEATDIDLIGDRERPHKWVVIYGDNGLGKSTLLRSFGIILTGQPALNTLFPSAEGWVFGTAKTAIVSVIITKGTGDRSTGAPRTRTIGLGMILTGTHLFEDVQGIHPAHSLYLLDRYKNRTYRAVSERRPSSSMKI